MAAEIVNSVLLKLGEAAIQEAIKLYGVTEKVEVVKRQLEWSKSFLKDADAKRKGNEETHERVKNWVRDVREVSFLIEDAIDMYLLKVESLSEKGQNFFKNTAKRMAKRPMKLYAMDRLDSAINNIKARFEEIKENRASFGIIDLEGSNIEITKPPKKPAFVNPDDDEIDLVGCEKERRYVIDLLLDKNTPRRSVVSIVGIGGLGKTALAEKVYQSVRDKFEFHVWLTVSNEFKQKDLLKIILKKAEIEVTNEDDLIIKVKEFLTGKKYFIVLDDVHSEEVWAQMAVALPDKQNCSRVLVTARNAEIAMAADLKCVCTLEFLSQEESIKLLFKKALPEENFDKNPYPLDLYEVAKDAARNCGGLPLALIVVGGRLSTKQPNKGAWERVVTTMNWVTDGKDCTEIFTSSYEDLPVPLRSCFMYFASFPEDHNYRAELITCLWIAEGFISPDERGTLEEVAQKYLEELDQRCMIKVLKRSLDGSILMFRVHDLLREFAIREAKEKDFLKVLSKKDDFYGNNRSVRRVTSQVNDPKWDENSSQEKQFTENINPNIRTLLLFGKVIPFSSQFMLLRVLVIYHYNGHHGDLFPDLLINTLKKLLQLRYLGFIGCNFPSEVVLPIEHLHKLITLVIRSCQEIKVPPRSLWGITSLRHVLVDRAYNLCDTLEGMSEPVKVPNLQTLGAVKINKPGIEFLNMLSLLKLHLINEDYSWDPIVTLLRKLKLASLTLESMEIPLEIIDTRRFDCYESLNILCLTGRWHLEDGQLSVAMFPQFLNMLTLESSCLDQKSMQVLEKLACLRILVLEMAYAGKTMICSNKGFPQLQHLTLAMLRINELEIEEGALPNLNQLEIRSCVKLQKVPNLQHVKNLKVFSLKSMPVNFKSMMENEENKHKVKNIRSINFLDIYE